MKEVRRRTHLSKRTFARDPVEFEVVKIDLTSEVDGLRWGATHSRRKSEEEVVWWRKESADYDL
jgi:hypothetical protein